MATTSIHDTADHCRIEIEGLFSSEVVTEIGQAWQRALEEAVSRSFIVDISDLSGYDAAGWKLLREMHRHGTATAARNAVALAFLNEISAPDRHGPALVYRAKGDRKRAMSDGTMAGNVSQIRAAVAGE